MVEGANEGQAIMGGIIAGQVILSYLTKVAESNSVSKLAGSISPWLLHQFLLEFLP